MNKNTWKPYLIGILLTEAVGGLAGLLTGEATEIYNSTIVKPALSPPAIVFPIVWAVLYALMGVGAARVWMAPLSPARKRSLRLFLVQLAFNFFWSIIFFNFQAFGLAFFWLAVLWILILRMILSLYEVDHLAAWLQLPYLLWVLFAAYLNFGVWKLN